MQNSPATSDDAERADALAPFLDPGVQAALQHMLVVLADFAMRNGLAPHSLIAAAAVAQGDQMGIDTILCGDASPDLVRSMTARLVETATSDDVVTDITLPRPN